MALTNKLTAIADAIRTKTGGSSPLSLDDMATAIGNLNTGSGDSASWNFLPPILDCYRYGKGVTYAQTQLNFYIPPDMLVAGKKLKISYRLDPGSSDVATRRRYKLEISRRENADYPTPSNTFVKPILSGYTTTYIIEDSYTWDITSEDTVYGLQIHMRIEDGSAWTDKYIGHHLYIKNLEVID